MATSATPYAVVDTGQTKCYNATTEIACPSAGQAFYGQDAQVQGNQPSYTLSGDGLTVLDNVTGLTWQRSPDTNGDGSIEANDKLTWTQAQARPAALNAARYGGYSDWRLPTIKELYSLIDFRGTDPSGQRDRHLRPDPLHRHRLLPVRLRRHQRRRAHHRFAVCVQHALRRQHRR